MIGKSISTIEWSSVESARRGVPDPQHTGRSTVFKNLSRVLVSMLVGAVVAAIGFSIATAAPSAGTTTAQQIAQIRDRLDTASRNHDVAAVRTATNDLGPVLAGVHDDLARGAVPPGVADPLAAAEKQNADLRSALSQRDGIFDSISQMIKQLMDELKQLLQQLLGGSTPPTKPTPPTPSPTPPAPAPAPPAP
jgi:hypothetical protein